MNLFKKQVELSFDKSSKIYDNHNALQKEVSEKLLNLFFDLKENKRDDLFLLDLGCGTGETSKKLLEKIKIKKIHMLDISNKMLQVSKKKISHDNIYFYKKDFDNFNDFKKYNIIMANMSVHWSKDFFHLIKKILNSIKKDTIILLSLPNSKSFSDLKQKHRKLLNDFPNISKLEKEFDSKKFYFEHKEIEHYQSFKNILDFFKNLKKTGTHVNSECKTEQKELFKLRVDSDNIIVNFKISYLLFKKIEN